MMWSVSLIILPLDQLPEILFEVSHLIRFQRNLSLQLLQIVCITKTVSVLLL